MKHLVNLAAEDFVQWLVRDAHFDGELSTNFASRDLDGDVLWQIKILSAKEELDVRQHLLNAQK